MRTMRFLPTIATAGFVLALPILLFTTNIRFLASDTGYLEGGLRRHDAAEKTGIALGELDYAVGAIVRYFEDDADTLRVLVFTGGEEEALFSEDETLHMEDVKGLMRTIFRANEVALGFVLAYMAATVLWAGERSGRELAREILAAVGVGALVGVAVGIVALVGFDAAWEQLHEVIFSNDLWLLDPSEDRLIQMFPETFWAEATFIVVGLALAEAAVLVAAAGGYLWFTRAPRGEEDAGEAEEDAAGADEDATDAGEDATEVDEAATGADEDATDAGEDATEVDEAATGADEDATGADEDATGADEDATGADEDAAKANEDPAKEDGDVADAEVDDEAMGADDGAEDQEEQPQPPPPQAQPPEAPNSGSI